MKKLYILTLLFLSILYSSQQTIDNYGFQNKNIFPAPATSEAYGISKVGKLPMDLFRGKANISIPFYTINVDGITIPISITYNTGGIKLNEVATTVGLGWSLNIPGSVNKTIMDKDDSKVPFFDRNINTYSSYSGYITHLSYDEQRRINLWNIYNGGYDTKPDLFHYNIPSLSGSFITKDNSALTIPYEDIKIGIENNKKINITDNTGNIHWFSSKNTSSNFDPTNPLSGELSSTLYRLDSIRTINNKTVKFFYEKEFGYTERNIIERIYTKTGLDYDPGNNYFNLPPKYEKWENSSSNSEKLISRIEFPMGTVEFSYSNDENGGLSLNGDMYRKDLNSNEGVALRRVIVKNKSNHIISDYKLNYDYFISNGINKDYEDYRLKLINVYNVLEQSFYKFSYNEEYSMPKRNANSDDYWGYINSLSNSSDGSNLPYKIHTEVDLFGVDFPAQVQRRDRSPNPTYSQIGILKSIEYPTGGKKNFYYEIPSTKTLDTNSYVTQGNFWKEISSSPDYSDPFEGGMFYDKTESYILDYSDAPITWKSLKVNYGFSNSCHNAYLTGDNHEVTETACFGNINFRNPSTNEIKKSFTSNGRLFEGEELINLPIKVELVLSRMGDCRCGVGAGLVWTKEVTDTIQSTNYLSGLRIRKVEDVDANNVSNIFEYKYGKYDSENKFEEISILKQPFNFTRIDKKLFRYFGDGGVEYHPSRIQDFFTLSSSGQTYNSYGSADAVTYPYVVEENGLGKTLYEFSDKDYNFQNLNVTEFADYNDWKNGLLLSTKYLNKAGDTVKTIRNEYDIKNLKNALSNYITNDPSKLAFAVDFNIIPSKIQLAPPGSSNGNLGIEGEIFYVTNKINYIESGKIENISITTKDFLTNGTLSTTVTNKYYDNDVNKPINLQSTVIETPDKNIKEITYQYAHENANQKLIDANMVGIPLKTTVIKKQNATDPGKTISKIETIYPTSLPDAQTGNLLLPKSVSSLDLLTGGMSTDVTYNQYDIKGNLLQYTTKSGVSTAIIWGYNNTQPIAKIEGATYSQVSSLAGTIVTASDTDASAGVNNDETSLLDLMKTFREALPNYQVTTYTYDPLVGVRSITSPNGIRQVYIYDTANRLKEVRENNQSGNLLKEYQYNYKPSN